MNLKKTMAALAVMAALVVVLTAQPVQAAQGDHILLDHGNGVTEWVEATPGSTYSEVLAASFGDTDFDFTSGIEVDGLDGRVVGTVGSSWRFYTWNDGWVDSVFDPNAVYSGGSFALGFYPEGVVPTETPVHRSSWTMVNGDALSSNSQSADLSDATGSLAWARSYAVDGSESYVCSTILVSGKYALVNSGGSYNNTVVPTLYCYDRYTGEVEWTFEYPRGVGYETATGTIVGGHVYLPTTGGELFRIPVVEGPGTGNANVKSIEIGVSPDRQVQGTGYVTGAASLVHDSGVLYFGASDASMYCLDLDLNVLWNTPLESRVYFVAPTVFDGRVYIGSLDGTLTVLDQTDGSVIQEERVFFITKHYNNYDREYGAVNRVAVMGDLLYFTFDDGLGMSATEGGIACYRIIDSGIERVFKDDTLGNIGDYVTPYVHDGFSGVLFAQTDGMYRMDSAGTITLVKGFDDSTRCPYTIVNDTYIYFAEYKRGGNVYTLDMSGNVLGSVKQPDLIEEYCMSGIAVVDDMFLIGTDGGAMAYEGQMPLIPVAEPGSDIPWGYVVLAIVLLIVLIGFVMLLKGARDAGMPLIPYVSSRLKEDNGFNNERTSKVRRNKKRLVKVIILGLIIGAVLFVTTLSYGPSGNYSPVDAVAYLFSAIGKNLSGAEMTYDEIIVFESRCARAVAAFFVGLGLSVSGAIYQAIIRNPMVDPYIMGVSAGAGVAAVAVIAFDFTFFGLLNNSVYATPVVAIIGGVIAFFATMLLAEKAGGSSINYVLGGVIIGLVFSAAQTLMLSIAGDKLNDAMSWLFGSFASISWEQTVLIAIPAFALSLVPLVWAKEFNLVLLGEDQAKQMGLDVRRFNRYMLVLASVLASICVAFVGIIGFVGLVVPHLCRMILGGDHRLVLPASMVVGGALMLAADLFSKMIMAPMELPVGAITTIIGAPVFAYLLIKKGRMYDG